MFREQKTGQCSWVMKLRLLKVWHSGTQGRVRTGPRAQLVCGSEGRVAGTELAASAGRGCRRAGYALLRALGNCCKGLRPGETQPDSLPSDSGKSPAASFVGSCSKDKSKGTQEGGHECFAMIRCLGWSRRGCCRRREESLVGVTGFSPCRGGGHSLGELPEQRQGGWKTRAALGKRRGG